MEKRAKMTPMARLLAAGKILPRLLTPMHAHAHWELVIYLKGRGATTLDGREHVFGPGTAVLIPPRIDHEDHATRPYQSIWIQFQNEGRQKPLVIQDGPQKPLRTLTELLVLHLSDRRLAATRQALLGAVLEVFHSLSAATPLHPAVENLRRTIHENVRNPDFRVQTGHSRELSPHHLSRLFTRELGLPPRQYLLETRLREASSLLALAAHSVAEVSRAFGFRDPFHFSKAFRKRYEVSPKDFRKGIR